MFLKKFFIICSLILSCSFLLSTESCTLAKDKKIIVCGVIKNGEAGFANSKKSISELVKNFKDYRIIIYENNSQDNTKNLYSSWAKEEKKLIFISKDLSSKFIDSYTPKIGDYRCEFIARARNIVIKKALERQYDDYEYVLMADLDEFEPWDIDSIIQTIENPQHEWDAVSANGSYDLYTIRSKEFRLNPELIGWSMWCDLQPKIGKLYAEILSSPEWYKVESAFGGLAIYKRKALIGTTYKGLVSPVYVDYLLKVDYSKDLIYSSSPEFFNRKILSNLCALKEWKRQSFSKDRVPVDAYVSDHVQMHFKMISNGFDKIYVNPSWKHLSKVHRNY